MILGIATSLNGVQVRLTDERWYHIIESHPEMTSLREAVLDAVEDPDYILRGRRGAYVAVVALGKQAWLHVFYVEKSRQDGFILSARVERQLDRARIVWRKDNQKE